MPSLGLIGAGGAAGFANAMERRVTDAQKLEELRQLMGLRMRAQGEEERGNLVREGLAGRGLDLEERGLGYRGEELGLKRDEAASQAQLLGELREAVPGIENPYARQAAVLQMGGVTLSPENLMGDTAAAARARATSAAQAQGQAQFAIRAPVAVTDASGQTVWADPRSAVGQPVGTTAGPKPATGEQLQTFAQYRRMEGAIKTMESLDNSLTPSDLVLIQGSAPFSGMLRQTSLSPEGKQYLQALRTYYDAKLRWESGATITPSETELEAAMVSHQFGDDPVTRKQKLDTMKETARGVAFSAGPAYEQFYGRPFDPLADPSTPSVAQKVLTEADIQASMQAKGWTRAQALAEAQRRGYTVR